MCVDVGGIIEHHCLNFLFVINQRTQCAKLFEVVYGRHNNVLYKYQLIPQKTKQSTSNCVLDFSPSWNVSVDRIKFVYVIISKWHYSSVWGGLFTYLHTRKDEWRFINPCVI